MYYGSEWGIEGDKKDGDYCLRPQIESPSWNGLSDLISLLSKIRGKSKSLTHGAYQQLYLTNSQFVFERSLESERIIAAVNISPDEHMAYFNAKANCGNDELTGKKVNFRDGLHMKAYSAMIISNHE